MRDDPEWFDSQWRAMLEDVFTYCPTEETSNAERRTSNVEPARMYRNAPAIASEAGDLVLWNDDETRVASIGPESATFVNNKFGDRLHLNRADLIDLIETRDGEKP